MILSLTLLFLATCIWGGAILGNKFLLSYYSPLWINSLRFILSTLLLLPILIKKKSYLKGARFLYYPLLPGLTLYLCILSHCYSMKYTTVAKSSFFITLYAFFTPLLSLLFHRKKYEFGLIPLSLLSLVGLALLCDFKMTEFNRGDGLALIGAIFGAYQIITIEWYGKYFDDVWEFNALQCLYMAVLSTLFAFLLSGPVSLSPLFSIQRDHLQSFLPLAILFLNAIFATIIGFSIQVYAQRKVSSHIVGQICLLISPIASLLAYLLFKEKMTPLQICGGTIIMISASLVPLYGKEVSSKTVSR